VPGTRRIHSQASGFSQASLRFILQNYKSLPKNAGDNGEREYDAEYDAGDTCVNVFEFSASVLETKVHRYFLTSYTWGEEPNIELHIKLDGKFVGKVEVDRGAWGEYDDNPDNVKDWKRIMNEVRKFADCVFVWYDVASEAHHVLRSGTKDQGITTWTWGEDLVMTPDHISRSDIVVLKKLFVYSNLELFGISSHAGICGSQVAPPHAHRWGEDNNLVYSTTYHSDHEEPRGWGAYIARVEIGYKYLGRTEPQYHINTGQACAGTINIPSW
jgi:hypothetical protein